MCNGCFRLIDIDKNKRCGIRSYHEYRTFMAAGEGFEPSHTESESAVLPLHNPAKRKDYYTKFFANVKKNLRLKPIKN